jgi:amino acid transporter
VSVRVAGRVNDALTLLKLSPLLLLVAFGLVYAAQHPDVVVDHLTPFAPFGYGEFVSGLLLVFWAYAGFELSTVPSGEVRDPEQTIPRALATGMVIVVLFYLSTNFVVYALVEHTTLATTATPLAVVGGVVFGGVGAAIMSAGAMVSVSGSNESDMLGSSRLAFAMAADGFLPHRFAAVHPRFRTPYIALIAQGLFAGALTFVDRIPDLISFAVVNLAFSFLLCALALRRLQRQQGGRPGPLRRALPDLAAVITVGLLLATSSAEKIAGAAVLVAGIVIFVIAAPRTVLPEARTLIIDPAIRLEHLSMRRMRFLGGLVGWFGGRRTP